MTDWQRFASLPKYGTTHRDKVAETNPMLKEIQTVVNSMSISIDAAMYWLPVSRAATMLPYVAGSGQDRLCCLNR